MKREVGPIIRVYHIVIFILILVLVLAVIEMVSHYLYTGRFRIGGGTALAASEVHPELFHDHSYVQSRRLFSGTVEPWMENALLTSSTARRVFTCSDHF